MKVFAILVHMILFWRLIMSSVLIAISLNRWFSFISIYAIMAHNIPARQFILALNNVGFIFPIMDAIQLLTAVFILTNRFQVLALLLISPIAITVFVYHMIIDPVGMPVGLLLVVPYLVLVGDSKDKLKRVIFN